MALSPVPPTFRGVWGHQFFFGTNLCVFEAFYEGSSRFYNKSEDLERGKKGLFQSLLKSEKGKTACFQSFYKSEKAKRGVLRGVGPLFVLIKKLK
jgi:hypothetical protein